MYGILFTKLVSWLNSLIALYNIHYDIIPIILHKDTLICVFVYDNNNNFIEIDISIENDNVIVRYTHPPLSSCTDVFSTNILENPSDIINIDHRNEIGIPRVLDLEKCMIFEP